MNEKVQALEELFDAHNTHVGNHLREFLQILDEHPRGTTSPISWLRMLDNYEPRIKALEEKVCKCSKTKP